MLPRYCTCRNEVPNYVAHNLSRTFAAFASCMRFGVAGTCYPWKDLGAEGEAGVWWVLLILNSVLLHPCDSLPAWCTHLYRTKEPESHLSRQFCWTSQTAGFVAWDIRGPPPGHLLLKVPPEKELQRFVTPQTPSLVFLVTIGLHWGEMNGRMDERTNKQIKGRTERREEVREGGGR